MKKEKLETIYDDLVKTTFVDDFMESYITDYENWTDEYQTYIDYKIIYNGTDDNIMLINKYAGGVFEATSDQPAIEFS